MAETAALPGSKRILVAPLDWGLGHATRCVPIIRELQAQGAEVIIAADRGPLALLKEEFPGAPTVRFPGYEIDYPTDGGMVLHFAKQVPRIVRKIGREHRMLQRLIREQALDGVISDNRFGLWSDDIPCAYISHQLRIKSPVMEPGLVWLHSRYINRYRFCLVPDNAAEPSLAGELVHSRLLPANGAYIGPLSRMVPQAEATDKRHEVMAIISGPEPQRSHFESLVLAQLKQLDAPSLLVRGVPGDHVVRQEGPVTVRGHLNAQDMQAAMLASRLILSRSGYSTLMDLATLGLPAVLVPTPGQTEQEYLARYHREQGHYFSMDQRSFDLEAMRAAASDYPGIRLNGNGAGLTAAVTALLQNIPETN
ncbi:MAG: glycosyltransferase [Bacteroidota bacterium]